MAFSITTTRRLRLDAGELLDVTRLAHGHRIVVPTAITAAAWTVCGGGAADFATTRGDALASRILAAARSQAVHSSASTMASAAMMFALEDVGARHLVELKLTVEPDDDGSPAATIDLAGR